MLDLLNQLDRFDVHTDVILATNHTESLDPSLLQPGRIDQKIKFLLPDIKTKWRISQVITQYPAVVWWSCDVWGEVTNVSSPAFWLC
jgi:ATP-dependent 26S proteasome regulatory subunit